MDEQVQAFEEIASLMDDLGMDNTGATLVAALMRKPTRAKALKDWLKQNPKATSAEVEMQAHIIAKTVEPTVRKPR